MAKIPKNRGIGPWQALKIFFWIFIEWLYYGDEL